jgi:hypothetical protein
VYAIRDYDHGYTDASTRADPGKKAVFGAAFEVKDLTSHIGTETVGLQLKDLTNQQKDELALVIAERSVVFFRDQDRSPQKQLELGEYYGEVEIHPQVPHVPGLSDFRQLAGFDEGVSSAQASGSQWELRGGTLICRSLQTFLLCYHVYRR